MGKKNKLEKQAEKRRLGVMESLAQTAGRVQSDVLGSYTGVPLAAEDEMPVQDADDL